MIRTEIDFQIKEYRLFLLRSDERVLRPLSNHEFIFDLTTELDRVSAIDVCEGTSVLNGVGLELVSKTRKIIWKKRKNRLKLHVFCYFVLSSI